MAASRPLLLRSNIPAPQEAGLGTSQPCSLLSIARLNGAISGLRALYLLFGSDRPNLARP
jgi:hypothetical protein